MDLAHRVKPGARVSLSAIPTDSTGPFSGKDDPRVKERLESDLARLADLGARLYAEKKQSLLVVLQAMDTAGKDGVLKHVVGPLDSRGLHVWSFGAPSEEERAHDFLWRFHFKAPRQGEMAFFNRSYYEDVLVVRVMNLEPRSVWKQRYQAIRDFERMLADRGTRVIKFYLHISKGEQRRRLQERIDVPDKRWKLDPRDFEARKHWDSYRRAYEDALSECATKEAPWYVVPSDHKWFRDLAVASALTEMLEEMKPQYPKPTMDVSKIVIP